MNHSETAIKKFEEGYNCAQSVLSTYSEKLNISKDLALKLASGFGAGMGRKQEVCGGISGAIMVLNFLYGRGENDDKEIQDLNYFKVRELIDKFTSKFNTINCKELLDGCNLLDSEGQELFKSKNLIEKCHDYVGSITKILDEIIENK